MQRKKQSHYQSETERKRKKEIIEIVFWVILCTIIFLLLGYIKHSVAEESEMLSPIQHILSEYGQGDEDSIRALNEHYDSFSALNYTDEKISAQIEEIVSDGVWSYSTTLVKPANGSNVMILPAGADISDQVAVSLDDEEGTYLELAQSNDSQLLAIYCYPKEYDDHGEYFFDYYQDENGGFYLLSGCRVDGDESRNTLTPVLQVYNVDLSTMKYTLRGYKEWDGSNILPFIPMVDYDYQVTDNSWINKVTLRKTGITTYLVIDWKNNDAAQSVSFVPLDQNGTNWPSGYALDTDAYYLEEIPERFTIQIRGEQEAEITAIMQEGDQI